MAETIKRLDWKRLLEEALTTPGNLGTTYARFWDYSITNLLLFRMQGIHEPVASASRWRAIGRRVLSNAQPKEVIVPVLVSEPAPQDAELNNPAEQATEQRAEASEPPPTTGEQQAKRERVARLVGFRAVRAVYTLSDTEGADLPPVKTPGWDLPTALGKLAIREVPFDSSDGNLQGYSYGLDIAINPIAVNPTKTRFHEIGHIVLGHTIPQYHAAYATHRGIREFEAESTAYLVMNELGQLDEDTASRSRGYIQHWLQDEQPPEAAIKHVFRAADAILKAGRIDANQRQNAT